MTENEKLVRDETEAIECLKSNKPTSGYLMLQESIDMAIKALEEVQQYRAIGTVEELETASKYLRLVKKHGTVGKTIEECAEYEEIGTPEECREAVTKQISRHPVDKTKPDSGYGNYYENARVIVCPNCNGRLKLKSKGKYCDKCGQKLNWENA